MYFITFTGDTFLKTHPTNSCSPFSESICKLFASSDNVCINLETTIGTGGIKAPKAFSFQAPPVSLKFVVDNKVNICNLANNHSLDYGRDGLQTTINHLNAQNIKIIGTEEHNCIEISSNGKSFCVCSYYGNQKGLARIDKNTIIADIKTYKKRVDYVFVCLHWGEEYVAYPKPVQQLLAHELIDSGASVIIGHHPHVMQGYEEYNGGLIFYSLGNFNFYVDHPYAKTLVQTKKAYCVGLNIDVMGTIKYDIIPININECWQPDIITEEKEKERFMIYLNRISEPLKGRIKNSFWYAEAAPHYFKNNMPSWKKRIRQYGFKHFVKMLKWFLNPSIYRYYLGMVQSIFNKKIIY